MFFKNLYLFRFPSLFGDVESEIQESGQLGIDAYGTSMPTLEEVFLRLGEEAEAESVSTLKSLIISDCLLFHK